MPKLGFVDDSGDEGSEPYDAEWPIIPREGEYVALALPSGDEVTARVARLCHKSSGDAFIGTLVWIEHVGDDDAFDPDAMIA
jgi:hypothetical protein